MQDKGDTHIELKKRNLARSTCIRCHIAKVGTEIVSAEKGRF